ncbi:ACP phosphodiesterase [Fulvivirgaceae bacterium BMA10]|uniref:ACP phosphodiesterase n=1 Tax=Splendidivirga corallicola TaxID=3051826 RepID=A0ABT8KWB7_9BACT|nr:ACP phosphodiesterase [Fulvivirgaceae bacterium BMA10]
MNFLAHIYLSGKSPKVMIGNFIGDFVKGKNYQKYDPEVQMGILLHRQIDWFTDKHEIVDKSKSRLWEKYRHYAGVIVDMFYDHFLAKNWSSYSDVPLDLFVQTTYSTIETYESILPPKARYMFPYMVKNNWLTNYAFVDGIDQALTGMSRRTSFRSNMEKAVEDLKTHYKAFHEEFVEFFPQLIEYSKDFRENYKNKGNSQP